MGIYNFVDWLKKMNEGDLIGADDPSDQFQFNRNDKITSDTAIDYEKLHQDISKLLLGKYHKEYMQFIKGLAESHTDRDLISLIHKVEGSDHHHDWQPPVRKSGEEIVLPIADRGIEQNSLDS